MYNDILDLIQIWLKDLIGESGSIKQLIFGFFMWIVAVGSLLGIGLICIESVVRVIDFVRRKIKHERDK